MTTSSAVARGVGIQRGDQRQPDQRADELGGDESGYRAGGDAGEGVGEHPADGHGRVGERGGAGEPVGGADVGADRRGG